MDSAVRAYVTMRDGGCVARFVNNNFEASRWPMLQGLPTPGRCRNEFGGDIRPNTLVGLQVDHVEDRDKLDFVHKAPTDPDHLWTMCPWHHERWATKAEVRAAAIEYIHAANDVAAKNGWPIRPPEEEH